MLYNHNINILKNYTEQLKNSAKIKAALDKLPAAEQERDKFFNEAPSNIQNAWFNEQSGGMSETDAMRQSSVSPSAYRAWKASFSKLNAAVSQYNNIVDSLTAENQKLADESNALANKTKTENGGGGFTPTAEEKDRFKAEKEWKAREEALNKIAYSTGNKNFENYTIRNIEIEIEYQKKILSRTDLTNQERLQAEASYYEAKKKLVDEDSRQTIDQETQIYNESVAIQKQRFIDGEMDQEVYQQSLELLELNHLRRMVSLYKEGTKERNSAEQAYQNRVIADQQKRQKETEDSRSSSDC